MTSAMRVTPRVARESARPQKVPRMDDFLVTSTCGQCEQHTHTEVNDSNHWCTQVFYPVVDAVVIWTKTETVFVWAMSAPEEFCLSRAIRMFALLLLLLLLLVRCGNGFWTRTFALSTLMLGRNCHRSTTLSKWRNDTTTKYKWNIECNKTAARYCTPKGLTQFHLMYLENKLTKIHIKNHNTIQRTWNTITRT